MRTLLIIPVLIVLCLAGGYVLTQAFVSKTPPLREMIAAALICLIASEAAMIPVIRMRGASQAAIAQAALVGTVIHLFVSCGLGGGVIITKAFGLSPSFVYWLVGLYWVTLVVVVVGLIGAVKQAPIASNITAGSPRPN